MDDYYKQRLKSELTFLPFLPRISMHYALPSSVGFHSSHWAVLDKMGSSETSRSLAQGRVNFQLAEDCSGSPLLEKNVEGDVKKASYISNHCRQLPEV